MPVQPTTIQNQNNQPEDYSASSGAPKDITSPQNPSPSITIQNGQPTAPAVFQKPLDLNARPTSPTVSTVTTPSDETQAVLPENSGIPATALETPEPQQPSENPLSANAKAIQDIIEQRQSLEQGALQDMIETDYKAMVADGEDPDMIQSTLQSQLPRYIRQAQQHAEDQLVQQAAQNTSGWTPVEQTGAALLSGLSGGASKSSIQSISPFEAVTASTPKEIQDDPNSFYSQTAGARKGSAIAQGIAEGAGAFVPMMGVGSLYGAGESLIGNMARQAATGATYEAVTRAIDPDKKMSLSDIATSAALFGVLPIARELPVIGQTAIQDAASKAEGIARAAGKTLTVGALAAGTDYVSSAIKSENSDPAAIAQNAAAMMVFHSSGMLDQFSGKWIDMKRNLAMDAADRGDMPGFYKYGTQTMDMAINDLDSQIGDLKGQPIMNANQANQYRDLLKKRDNYETIRGFMASGGETGEIAPQIDNSQPVPATNPSEIPTSSTESIIPKQEIDNAAPEELQKMVDNIPDPTDKEVQTNPPKDPADYIKNSDYQDELNAPYEQEGISSRTTPANIDLPPVGTWKIDDKYNGLYGHDIEQLRAIPINQLNTTELDENGQLSSEKKGDDLQYSQWIKEGKQYPPIQVLQREDGTLAVADGHRRLLAAKSEGMDKILAWVSPIAPSPSGDLDSNGKPIMTGLTYEIATGKPLGSNPMPEGFKQASIQKVQNETTNNVSKATVQTVKGPQESTQAAPQEVGAKTPTPGTEYNPENNRSMFSLPNESENPSQKIARMMDPVADLRDMISEENSIHANQDDQTMANRRKSTLLKAIKGYTDPIIPGVWTETGYNEVSDTLRKNNIPHTVFAIDGQNLGGANKAFDHHIANQHMIKLWGDILARKVNAAGGMICRSKGDELKGILVMPKSKAESLLQSIHDEIEASKNRLGLSAIPHPKHNGMPTGAMGINYGLAEWKPGKNVGEVERQADAASSGMNENKLFDISNKTGYTYNEQKENYEPRAENRSIRPETRQSGNQNIEAGGNIGRTEGGEAGQGKNVADVSKTSGKESANPVKPFNQIVPSDVNQSPTPEQIKSGKYKKVDTEFGNQPITIEHPAGSVRHGKDASGKHWAVQMKDHYGFIKGAPGADKDELDCFINPKATTTDGPVFIINQNNPETGKFDEHKVMFGFPTEEAAKQAYLSNYSKDWKGFSSIVRSDSEPAFDQWAYNNKPYGQPVTEEQVNRKPGEKFDVKMVSPNDPEVQAAWKPVQEFNNKMEEAFERIMKADPKLVMEYADAYLMGKSAKIEKAQLARAFNLTEAEQAKIKRGEKTGRPEVQEFVNSLMPEAKSQLDSQFQAVDTSTKENFVRSVIEYHYEKDLRITRGDIIKEVSLKRAQYENLSKDKEKELWDKAAHESLADAAEQHFAIHPDYQEETEATNIAHTIQRVYEDYLSDPEIEKINSELTYASSPVRPDAEGRNVKWATGEMAMYDRSAGLLGDMAMAWYNQKAPKVIIRKLVIHEAIVHHLLSQWLDRPENRPLQNSLFHIMQKEIADNHPDIQELNRNYEQQLKAEEEENGTRARKRVLFEEWMAKKAEQWDRARFQNANGERVSPAMILAKRAWIAIQKFIKNLLKKMGIRELSTNDMAQASLSDFLSDVRNGGVASERTMERAHERAMEIINRQEQQADIEKTQPIARGKYFSAKPIDESDLQDVHEEVGRLQEHLKRLQERQYHPSNAPVVYKGQTITLTRLNEIRKQHMIDQTKGEISRFSAIRSRLLDEYMGRKPVRSFSSTGTPEQRAAFAAKEVSAVRQSKAEEAFDNLPDDAKKQIANIMGDSNSDSGKLSNMDKETQKTVSDVLNGGVTTVGVEAKLADRVRKIMADNGGLDERPKRLNAMTEQSTDLFGKPLENEELKAIEKFKREKAEKATLSANTEVNDLPLFNNNIEARTAGAQQSLFSKTAAETAGAITKQELIQAKADWDKLGTESPYFKKWLGQSKVVDDAGKPLVVYSGHSNPELYGDQFKPKKATAGGFYASEDPEIASGYALGKYGSKEEYPDGSQYRLEGKNGKLNKNLGNYELSEQQKEKFDSMRNEVTGKYHEPKYRSLHDMMNWAKDNKNYDPVARKLLANPYSLKNIFDYNEQMGFNIAYDKHDENLKHGFEKQNKNETEEILDGLGIKWNSYDWQQPGTMPLYLKIEKPIDADKPFPSDLLQALKVAAKGERERTESEKSYSHWTKDYPLKEFIRDIESGDEFWTTQVPTKALKVFRQFGYDGIKERSNKGSDLPRSDRGINWIAFDPEQIKSAIGNRGTFSSESPSMLMSRSGEPVAPAEGPMGSFYHPTETAASELPMEKGTGEQFLRMLKKAPGVKEAELVWMDVPNFLNGKEKVTKQELLDYIRENNVSIEEKSLGSKKPMSMNEASIQTYNVPFDQLADEQKYHLTADMKMENDRRKKHGDTKYSGYTLPGGENYREVLLTIPTEKQIPILESYQRFENGELISQGDARAKERWMAEDPNADILPAHRPNEQIAQQMMVYQSSHWSEPNVFAHIRLNDRIAPDGRKILFIEEIQSDWAREARKEGVLPRKPSKENLVAKRVETNGDHYWQIENKQGKFILNVMPYEAKTEEAAIDNAIDQIEQGNPFGGGTKVPDQPFLKNWSDIALRRTLQMAAEEGYDGIAWINGKQTADRYDLSETIKNVEAMPIYEDESQIRLKIRTDRTQEIFDAPKDKLADYVGKDLADKILKDYNRKYVEILKEADDVWADKSKSYSESKDIANRLEKEYDSIDLNYSGNDLKIGGEWASHLYDKQVPDFFNKFGKQWEVKVGDIDLSTGKEYKPGVNVPGSQQYIPITDQMKVSLRTKRLPMFAVESNNHVPYPEPRFDAQLKMDLPTPSRLKMMADEAKQGWDDIRKLKVFTPFRRVLNKWNAAKQVSSMSSREIVEKIKKIEPSANMRMAMTVYREAAGDIATLEHWASTTEDKKLRAKYLLAQHLPDRDKEALEWIGRLYDRLLEEAIAHGVVAHGRENYVARMLQHEIGGESSNAGKSRKLLTSTRFSQERVFPTIYDAEQAGMKTVQPDIAELTAYYNWEIGSVIANRTFIKDLSETNDENGNPLAVPSGMMNILTENELSGEPLINPLSPDEIAKTVYIIRPRAKTAAYDQYKPVDHPALKKWKVVGHTKDGGTILYPGELIVHPAIHSHMRKVLGDDRFARWLNSEAHGAEKAAQLAIKGVEKFQNATKQFMFVASMFHYVQEGTHALGYGINPFKIVPIDLLHDGRQRAWAEHSLQFFGDYHSQDLFKEGLMSGPLLYKVPGIGPATKVMSEILFEKYIPSLKLMTAERIMSGLKVLYRSELASGRVTEDDLMYEAARQANEAYGHQNYNDMGRSQTVQHILRMACLAPDFLESRVRQAATAATLPTGNKAASFAAINIASIAIGVFVVARALNALFNDGDPRWDDAFGVVKGHRRYSLRFVGADMLDAWKSPRKYIAGRVSPVIGKAVQYAITGKDYRGQDEEFHRFLLDLIAGPIPISIAGAVPVSSSNKDLNAFDSFVSAMGVGVSRYSPTQDMYDKAKEWKEKHGIEDKTKDKSYPPSPFRDLRNALIDQDEDLAKERLEALLKNPDIAYIHSDDPTVNDRNENRKIAERFHNTLFRPLSGSWQNEPEFYADLSDNDKNLYKKAQDERVLIWDAFRKIEPQANYLPEPKQFNPDHPFFKQVARKRNKLYFRGIQ